MGVFVCRIGLWVVGSRLWVLGCALWVVGCGSLSSIVCSPSSFLRLSNCVTV